MTYGIDLNDDDVYDSFSGTNYDWGVYNRISNGGNEPGRWRTLTKDEWTYLVGSNSNRSGRWGFASIAYSVDATAKGVVLFPDELTLPEGFTAGNTSDGYACQVYTSTEWEAMQAAGAVFLPVTGWRLGNNYRHRLAGATANENEEKEGMYWSSTVVDFGETGHILHFKKGGNNNYSVLFTASSFSCGLAVRLCMDVR